MSQSVSAQVYEHPIARQQKGGMQIEKVMLSDSQTVVKAFCVNDTYRPSALISTSAPGSNNAFRLIARQRFYHIKKVNGIPFSPESFTLNFGDTVYFELVFEAIPKGVAIIDLVEGATTVENAWMVYGLQLSPTHLHNGTFSIFTDESSFAAYFKKNSLRLWEVEGFWQLSARFSDKKNKVEKPYCNDQKVAIVRENNDFIVYNMNGEKLDILFKHFKRERYVLTLPLKNVYPLQLTFKAKGSPMLLNAKLSRKQVKALGMYEDFKGKGRIYLKTEWKRR